MSVLHHCQCSDNPFALNQPCVAQLPPLRQNVGESRRVSCHRCGNIRRRRNTFCSKCPHTFCLRCTEKMKADYGMQTFVGGCPVCKELCCCGKNKSHSCTRRNHCYRKCPTTKKFRSTDNDSFDENIPHGGPSKSSFLMSCNQQKESIRTLSGPTGSSISVPESDGEAWSISSELDIVDAHQFDIEMRSPSSMGESLFQFSRDDFGLSSVHPLLLSDVAGLSPNVNIHGGMKSDSSRIEIARLTGDPARPEEKPFLPHVEFSRSRQVKSPAKARLEQDGDHGVTIASGVTTTPGSISGNANLEDGFAEFDTMMESYEDQLSPVFEVLSDRNFENEVENFPNYHRAEDSTAMSVSPVATAGSHCIPAFIARSSSLVEGASRPSLVYRAISPGGDSMNTQIPVPGSSHRILSPYMSEENKENWRDNQSCANPFDHIVEI